MSSNVRATIMFRKIGLFQEIDSRLEKSVDPRCPWGADPTLQGTSEVQLILYPA